MLLLSFSRITWPFERPEKQGLSVHIHRIRFLEKSTEMFLQLPRFRLSSGFLSLSLGHSSDVGEMIDNQIIKCRQMERKYLIDIIKCLKFLSRQGIPLQGHDNNDNLTQILLLLGIIDDNITKHMVK